MPLSPESIESIAKAILATQNQAAAHHDPYDFDHPESNQWKPPEWLKYVTPLVVIILGFGWTNLRSSSTADAVEIKLVNDKIDALETRLPLDYVPRAEHMRNAEIDRSLTKEREDRITRIEAKVDRIIENQETKAALK